MESSASVTTALLVLCVTGGYVFASVFKPSLIYSAREDGHRLYFRAVFYASVSVAIALQLEFIGFLNNESANYASNGADAWANFLSTFSDSGALHFTLIKAYCLAIFLPYLLNTVLHLINLICLARSGEPLLSLFLARSAIEGNDFESMIYRAQTTQTPVLITLKSRKIYIGWVVDAPNPELVRRNLKILPLVSGVRGENFQRLEITTNYTSVFSQMSSNGDFDITQFEVVVPTDQVSVVHLFDFKTYGEFNPPSKL